MITKKRRLGAVQRDTALEMAGDCLFLTTIVQIAGSSSGYQKHLLQIIQEAQPQGGWFDAKVIHLQQTLFFCLH